MGLKPCHLGSRAFAMLEAEYLCKMLRALRGSLAGLRFVTSFWCSTADSIYLATWSLYLEDSCRLGIGQAEQGNNKTCTRHSVGMFTAGTDVLLGREAAGPDASTRQQEWEHVRGSIPCLSAFFYMRRGPAEAVCTRSEGVTSSSPRGIVNFPKILREPCF